MREQLQSLTAVLHETDERLAAGPAGLARIWPTGFGTLDAYLGGGVRSGELVLLGGPQGLGKTTFALQLLRHVAASGRAAVYFSFEHDPQSLLERLVAVEAADRAGGMDSVGVNRVREVFEGTDGLSGSLVDRLAHTSGGAEALRALQGYGDRLLIHRSSGITTSVDTVREIIQQVHASTGQPPFVVVDYLQKVRVPDGAAVEEERVTSVVEGLKDLALDLEVPVFAVVAADKEGLATGKRMRVNNLRGSSALAYEADIVLIMNNKYDVIARHHLMYNVTNAERFHDWAVVSIEKNRSGLDKIDLEFRKRFDQSRFEAEGQHVTEQLVDERVFVE